MKNERSKAVSLSLSRRSDLRQLRRDFDPHPDRRSGKPAFVISWCQQHGHPDNAVAALDRSSLDIKARGLSAGSPAGDPHIADRTFEVCRRGAELALQDLFDNGKL